MNLRIAFIVLVALLVVSGISFSLRNPSAVYCEALGYEYAINSTPEGELGLCRIGGQDVDAWKFLQGEAATESSFCARQGYLIRTVNDSSKCLRFLTGSCAVCVLANGSEVEVTELMGLGFRETVCGDWVCGVPEDPFTCPTDCFLEEYWQWLLLLIVLAALLLVFLRKRTVKRP